MKYSICLIYFLANFFYLSAFSQKLADTTYFQQINLQRQQKDSLFLSEKSPLLYDNIKIFKGLPYFEADEKYKVEAIFTKNENPPSFPMKTTTDRLPLYTVFGTLDFTLNGQKIRLNVYQSLDLKRRPGFQDYLFIPFKDLTSGKETYSGGRYLDFKIPSTDKVTIDFNTAYNPYCAYNNIYSCPLVPKDNHLKIKILAGERQ